MTRSPSHAYLGTMPTRASKPKKRDFAEIAFDVVAQATGQREKVTPAEPPPPPDPETVRAAAAALSRLGASKGGKARAANLSRAKRRAIARKAAASRWAKQSRRTPDRIAAFFNGIASVLAAKADVERGASKE